MYFENQLGLPSQSQFYKGNLHSHTTVSDGCLSPKEAAAMFRARGYHFVCLSEHDRYTDWRDTLNCEDFLILPGLEASACLLKEEDDPLPLKVHHLNGILGTKAMEQDAEEAFSHGELLPPPIHYGNWDGLAAAQGVVDTLHRHGLFVTYNHPIWSRIAPEDILELQGLWAMEIYNYNTVNESATGADTTYWDLMLRSGRQVFAFASDDNHNQGIFDDACGAWIQVAAPSLSHEAIVSALLQGDFYSSCGPEIFGWGVENDCVWVECSPCERVSFICGGFVHAGATQISADRDGICRAEFPLTGKETYVRVECVDYDKKTAWTNAIFLKPEK